MLKTTKKWLIAAAFLIIIGLIMFAVVMTKYNWDFTKLSTKNYETNTYDIITEFSNISINTDNVDITFLLSDDETCKVVCYEETTLKHSVKVENHTLIVENVNQKAWHNYVEINFDSPKITVYLPKTEYNSLLIIESTGDIIIPNSFTFKDVFVSVSTGDVTNFSAANKIKITTDTGDINIKNVSADTLEFNVSTGKIDLENVLCKNATLDGSTGDIKLARVIAEEKIVINLDTGDVELNNCDAEGLDITTNTGDVIGSLLSEKIFITSTDTGNIAVPDGRSGGECKIATNTGDIEIKLAS